MCNNPTTQDKESNYYINTLDYYVEKNLLIRAEDPDLVQYNYSNYCNNNHLFDSITTFNRGNIYDKRTGKLIARSMPKFFNFEQESKEKQIELINQPNFICTKKYDGCLGILYRYKGELRCNSRGSFNSFVTDAIKDIWNQYNLECTKQYNLIVEVIHPTTKIIVNYNEEKGLKLITAYNAFQFNEVSFDELNNISKETGIPIVETYDWNYDQLFEWQKQKTDINSLEEGFVLRYPDNYRVKIKSIQYLDIARAMANLSKKKLWEIWYDDVKDETNHLDDFINDLPDECKDEANQMLEELQTEFRTVWDFAEIELEDFREKTNKELGLYYKDNPSKYSSYVFARRANKSKQAACVLLKLIQPF